MLCTFWITNVSLVRPRRPKIIKTLFQRQQNGLLGVLVHTLASQAQHIDHQTTGQWHESTVRADIYTTWPSAPRLIKYTLTQCTAHTPHGVSPISCYICLNVFNNMYSFSPLFIYSTRILFITVILCSHNTDVCTTSMYPRWTMCVILAKYWLWLPDDGFLVNRNMLEQPP